MREIIIDNNFLLMVISRFGIAFGFGDNTIRETCEANQVDTDTFLAVANMVSGKDYSDYQVSLPSLMGYLKRAHTAVLEFSLPTIRRKLIEAINYVETNDVSFLLMKFYDDYVVEVRRHMEYENNTIFSYVEQLLESRLDDKFNIGRFTGNHGHMGTKLKELKDIFIYHYNQRDNDMLSSVLYDIIACEQDLMSHFEVENLLFVPAVQKLEKSLRAKLASENGADQGMDDDDHQQQLDMLSEREKEIIRYVAQGLSNKEIADKLCLSVHTVTTHRRNLSAKLDIHSPAALTIFAILHNLVDLNEVKLR
jgi:regulator of cell morphogenesis and NO signaling